VRALLISSFVEIDRKDFRLAGAFATFPGWSDLFHTCVRMETCVLKISKRGKEKKNARTGYSVEITRFSSRGGIIAFSLS